MSIGPHAVVEQLKDYFFRYYETAFSIRDEGVRAERQGLMRERGAIFQEPYLELLPEYLSTPETVAEVLRDAGAPDELAELVLRALLPADLIDPRLWNHQAEALKRSLGGANVVITS